MTLEYFLALSIALVLAGLIQIAAQALLLRWLLRQPGRKPLPVVEPSAPKDGPPPVRYERTFCYADGHTERRDYWTHVPNPWTHDTGQSLYPQSALVEMRDKEIR